MFHETDFPFLAEKGHIVSLVGGGGKTTLIYNMAAHCAHKGWHVLVTTTTHIMKPPGSIWARTSEQLDALWNGGHYAVVGMESPGEKLSALPEWQMQQLMTQADLMLVEADGAKRMPCKVPADHEPVLLPQCDVVLAVAGASALQKPLQAVCFRAELASELLAVSQDAVLTPELLAGILADRRGGRKSAGNRNFCAVINQIDTVEQRILAEKAALILKEHYQVPCVLTHFKEEERV